MTKSHVVVVEGSGVVVVVVCCMFSHFSTAARVAMAVQARQLVEDLMRFEMSLPAPPRPAKKVFKKSNPEVPTLESYSVPPGQEFWDTFPKNEDLGVRAPFNIDTDALLEMCRKINYNDMGEVRAVVRDFLFGSDQRLNRARFRPTHNKNNESVGSMEWGEAVVDALCSWIKLKIVAGPFDAPPSGSHVIKMTVRPKPDGKARIIMDMSSPRDRSFNDAIAKGSYPARMAMVEDLLDALNHCGRGSWLTKSDWNNAYKHFPVCKEDQLYQWFSVLGKFFVELCLTFGSKSSPGIYNRGARLPIVIARRMTNFSARCSLQHLDDLCSVGPGSDDRLERFYRCYWKVCEEVGISLQEDDKGGDKAFGPCQRGVCLGVLFDSSEWTWTLPEEKIHLYWNDLKDMLACDEMVAKSVKSVVGKILYVMPLLPGAEYHVSSLIKLQNYTESLKEMVPVNEEAKHQMRWWLVMLRLLGYGVPIPSVHRKTSPPPLAVVVDSDAAGGSLVFPDQGVGVFCRGGWFNMSWPGFINSEEVAPCCGSMWRHKLSFLELIGHMLSLVCFAEEVANRSMVTRIDNSGSCAMWRRGYDLKCGVNDSLLYACHVVASGLNCNAFVKKVRRCSDTGSQITDHLSKGKLDEFRALSPVGRGRGESELLKRRCSRVFLKWVRRPVEDRMLGFRVLEEMRGWGIPTVGWMGNLVQD